MFSESVVVWQLMQPALLRSASAAVCCSGAGGAPSECPAAAPCSAARAAGMPKTARLAKRPVKMNVRTDMLISYDYVGQNRVQEVAAAEWHRAPLGVEQRVQPTA